LEDLQVAECKFQIADGDYALIAEEGPAVENHSPSDEEYVSGLIKMAGMTLIALAIPLGAGIAVRDIKRYGGERAILVCFSIIVAMSALGFILIWAGGKFAKRYGRTRGNSQP
jgi:hypothetical protein